MLNAEQRILTRAKRTGQAKAGFFVFIDTTCSRFALDSFFSRHERSETGEAKPVLDNGISLLQN